MNILEQILGSQSGLINVQTKKEQKTNTYSYNYTSTSSENYSPTITYSPVIITNSPNANTSSRPRVETSVEPTTEPVIKFIPTTKPAQNESSAGASGIIGAVMPYVIIGGVLYFLLK